jgi:hypothetical protein
MKKIIALISISLVFFIETIFAQIETPVTWKYSAKRTNETEALLVFEANIKPLWHLYGQFFPDGGPIRLVFKFNKSDKYSLIGKAVESPKPIEEKDEVFEINVQYFKNSATFTQKIKLLNKQALEVTGSIEGQACLEDGKCVPVKEDFKFQVSASAADSKKK